MNDVIIVSIGIISITIIVVFLIYLLVIITKLMVNNKHKEQMEMIKGCKK